MNTDVRNIWENCLSFIRDNVTTDVYDVWFKPIEPVELTSDNTLVIMVPSMFFMEWIEDHYINLIWSALTKELGARPKLIYNIKMENNPNKTEQATEQLPSSNRKATSMEVLGYKQKPQQSYNPYVVPGLVEIEEVKVDSQLNPNKNFDTFIEGESNRLARSAGKAITERPGGTSFNPLFIFGGVGLGKTHLAHAIGNEIQEKHPKKRILYIEAEDFTKQYSVAAKNNNRTDFIHFYQQIDVLIIDNVQFFASKPGTQDVFFQIFNHLHQNGKQLILTSDKAPVDIQDVEQRLLSRFKWGLSAELQAPDYQMRKRILQAILYRDGVEMNEEIVDYIAQNVKTNIRELEGVNTSLMAEALFNKKEITVEYIQEIVSEYFQLSIEELQSKTRKRHVVQARQLAMFFAKKYTKLSLANIGKSIGKRDHATVLHACKTVDNLNETDKQFRKFLSDLTTKINNR